MSVKQATWGIDAWNRLHLTIRILLAFLAITLFGRLLIWYFDGRDTMDAALEDRDQDRVVALLRKGFDPNADVCTQWELPSWLQTSQIQALVQPLDPMLPHRCIQTKPFLIAAIDKLYWPLPVVEELIRQNTDLHIKDALQQDARDTAIMDGNPEVVQVLAPHFPWIGLPAKEQLRLYRLAVESRDERNQILVLQNLRGANNPLAPELLREVIERPNPPALEFLLKNGFTPDSRIGRNRATALMLAVSRQGLPGVRAMMKRGANPNLQDAEGETALDYALLAPIPDPHIIHELLKAGARIDLPTDNQNKRKIALQAIKKRMASVRGRTKMPWGPPAYPDLPKRPITDWNQWTRIAGLPQ